MSDSTEQLLIAPHLGNETGVTTNQFTTLTAAEREGSSVPDVEISTKVLTIGVRYHKNGDGANRGAAFNSFQAQFDATILQSLIAMPDTNWVLVGGNARLVDNFAGTFRAANAIAAKITVREVSETHGDSTFSTGSWTLTATIEATYRIMTSDRPKVLSNAVKATGDNLKRVIAAL